MAKKQKAPTWRPSASECDWPSDPPVIVSLPDDAAEQLTRAINLGDPFPPELCRNVLETVNGYLFAIVHLDERPLGSEVLGALNAIRDSAAKLSDALKNADMIRKVLLLDKLSVPIPGWDDSKATEAWDSLMTLIQNISSSAQAAADHSLAFPVGHRRNNGLSNYL
jgi:hypothetical protein